MPDERRQFLVLYRDFLRRIIDLDLLSARGEIEKLLVQFAAILAAFNFTFMVVVGPKYLGAMPGAHRTSMRGELDFLVATTMTVAGLFAVLAWNAVLPDRRDALILGLLPVRTRTVFAAKAAAIASVLAGAIFALNVFSGFTYPFIALPADAGALAAARSFAGYWLAMAASGLFVCCGLFAIEGLAALVLPYRHFLGASSFLQLAAFFTVLTAWLLQPPGAPPWLPSSWFFGLQQQWSGAVPFHPLAGRALVGLLCACGAAVLAFGLGYGRSFRKIVEQPDILPAARRRLPRLAHAFLRRPIDGAIVLFTARTIARSRQHRLYLAAYTGIGLAVAFAYARDLLYGSSDPYARTLGLVWNRPNFPLLIGGLALVCFAVLGTRAIFSLPVALGANWVFRLTEVVPPGAYFRAVRKALTLTAVLPLGAAAAAVYFAIWPARPAAEHMLVISMAAAALVHGALDQFRKVPFACSYLPGKANLHVRIGVYAMGALTVASILVQIEYFTMDHPVGFAIYCAVWLAAASIAWRRWQQFAGAPYNWLQFEDVAPAAIESLDLHNPPPFPPSAPLPPLEPGVSIRPRPILTLSSAVAPAPRVPARVRIEHLLADLRSGARLFRRAPGFSAAAIALMAIGIGGNTAVYSVIHAILSRPAPGVRTGNLVNIAASLPQDPSGDVIAFPIFTDFLEHSTAVRSMAAASFERFAMTTRDGTCELRGEAITPGYFDLLGVPIVKGRGFTPEEASGKTGLAAVIAYHVWQNQFQSAPDISGRQVLLNGIPATVVGVSAPEFRGTHFGPNFEIGVPIVGYAKLHGGAAALARSGVEVLGRLAPGTSIAQAQAEFDILSRRIQAAYPGLGRQRILVEPYSATSFGPWQSAQARMFMALLTGVALLTLLVVCANVANLVLGRSAARARELAVRQSLGASRARILSMLLAEGLLLSAAAAAAAWGFAWWVARAIPALIPPLPSGAHIEPDLSPDWRVAVYALALAVFGALVFTLAPWLRTWRLELLPFLKAGEQGVIQGRSQLTNVLVVVQLSFCVLLLGGAGLASRSIFLIRAADLGFPKDHRLILRLNTLGSAINRDAMLEGLRRRIGALTNVTAVSYATAVPPDPFGQFGARSGDTPFRGMVAGPGYLDALGVRVDGRDFRESDSGRDTALLTRAIAERLFGGAALGRTLEIFGRPYEVIGIVPNGAYSGFEQQGGDQFVFISRALAGGAGIEYFNIRYAGPLAAVAAPVRDIVRDLSAGERIVGTLDTMDSYLEQYTAPALVIASLLSLFSAGSLIVAGIGLYAVIAFHTARRTREFGVRMALGATPRDVLRTVFREGLLLTVAGSTAGVALSAAALRLLRGLLFGVSPADPIAWAGVALLLAAVGMAACYVPARRAGCIQPVEALRQD